MTLVKIDTRRIHDWDTFQDAFAEAFGFPGFYGRNMNAWIDCLTYLDDPGDRMTKVQAPPGGIVTLELEHAADFASRCPEQYAAVLESSAFVNWRRIAMGQSPVL